MQLHTKEIWIKGDSVLIDIQNKFTAYFPFLTIDFLESSSLTSPVRSIIINPCTLINKLITIKLPQKINIDGSRTVADLISDFKNSLGLCVQVSRKSGNVWNVISVTTSWTLDSQNLAGQFISSEMSGPEKQN